MNRAEELRRKGCVSLQGLNKREQVQRQESVEAPVLEPL